ncbi:hypothetical protein HL666_29810 [Bradyrhizobium sp. 83002]|uniref:hypothetical protein n=1 Tax=Bradyrhizobium aeschynomenes TaxID=2734909 RepID=UPI001553C5F8|nr:hypothetical protein [Bradyrhizobium aeschynomenes]NPU14978.1 hypothetical protein [Bradyrhizobium aeschynomenes]
MTVTTTSDSHASKPDNPLSDFLTPEAMLTPGVAGSLTMMITNALTVNFAMPRAWVGLGLSFVFGLLVLATTRNLLQKTVFYVLNSLVIFCVAAGANGIGAGASLHAGLSLTTTAFAEDISSEAAQKQRTLQYCSNLAQAVADAQKQNQPSEKIVELIKPCQAVSRDLLQGNNEFKPAASSLAPTGKFFSPWKF